MTPTLAVLRRTLHRLRLPTEGGVHFHNGPQGQPVPCFEDSCGSPRLSV
jgi:hypothetical protein